MCTPVCVAVSYLAHPRDSHITAVSVHCYMWLFPGPPQSQLYLCFLHALFYVAVPYLVHPRASCISAVSLQHPVWLSPTCSTPKPDASLFAPEETEAQGPPLRILNGIRGRGIFNGGGAMIFPSRGQFSKSRWGLGTHTEVGAELKIYYIYIYTYKRKKNTGRGVSAQVGKGRGQDMPPPRKGGEGRKGLLPRGVAHDLDAMLLELSPQQ